jgi:hypothetical protein
LERLEYTHLRRLAANVGKLYGFSADDILAEARRVLALPDDQQRQVLHRLYKELSEQEALELDAITQRHAAILRRERRALGGPTTMARSLQARIKPLEAPHDDLAHTAARTYAMLRACYTVLSRLDGDPIPSDADLWTMAQVEAR